MFLKSLNSTKDRGKNLKKLRKQLIREFSAQDLILYIVCGGNYIFSFFKGT